MTQRQDPATPIVDQALLLLSTLETVRAVALTGSRARCHADALSDVDLLILTAKAVPGGSDRLRQYREAGLGEPLLVDRPAGDARRDCLRSDDVILDLYWLPVPVADHALHDLERDYDRDEALASAVDAADPLYDPEDALGRLQRAVPAYPIERAIHRVRRALHQAQLDFFDLRRLESAAVRGDALAFQQARCASLDTLLMGLFALNRTWYGGGNCLVEHFSGLPLLPPDAPSRVESLILHTGPDATLAGAYDSLMGLFRDTATLARQAFPEAPLPATFA